MTVICFTCRKSHVEGDPLCEHTLAVRTLRQPPAPPGTPRPFLGSALRSAQQGLDSEMRRAIASMTTIKAGRR